MCLQARKLLLKAGVYGDFLVLVVGGVLTAAQRLERRFSLGTSLADRFLRSVKIVVGLALSRELIPTSLCVPRFNARRRGGAEKKIILTALSGGGACVYFFFDQGLL